MMNKARGVILIHTLVLSAVAAYLLGGLVTWAASSGKASRQMITQENSLQIAEAGIDYYRWHLAHAPTDFQDGTGAAGPYVHNFTDKDGNVVGQYSLDITPPTLGSTLVTIRSTGQVTGAPQLARTIRVQLAKPSLAKYAIAANDVMRFGEGTEVFGPIHSNGGIRFDGLAHNIVSSAVASYDDPDHTGGNEFGVHTHVSPTDPLPPTSVPARTDVFLAGRQFPVPAIDFVGITADLAQMKSDAQTTGFYRAGSGSLGYHIVLKTNDTFDLYRVTSLVNAPSGCTNSQNQTGWGTWSINNQVLLGNYAFPTNGIIFLEDDVWLNGQINSAHLTIVAAYLPDNAPLRKNITINNDLLYTTYDGSDVIGLIAQNNINVGMVSENDLKIDGALISQNGRIGRYYYRPPGGGSQRCNPYDTRQTISLWGMLGSALRYGFGYTDNTGYLTRNISYDAGLLYTPPPSFPLASDQYITLSWDEE